VISLLVRPAAAGAAAPVQPKATVAAATVAAGRLISVVVVIAICHPAIHLAPTYREPPFRRLLPAVVFSLLPAFWAPVFTERHLR
jgi:hypothetical protein